MCHVPCAGRATPPHTWHVRCGPPIPGRRPRRSAPTPDTGSGLQRKTPAKKQAALQKAEGRERRPQSPRTRVHTRYPNDGRHFGLGRMDRACGESPSAAATGCVLAPPRLLRPAPPPTHPPPPPTTRLVDSDVRLLRSIYLSPTDQNGCRGETKRRRPPPQPLTAAPTQRPSSWRSGRRSSSRRSRAQPGEGNWWGETGEWRGSAVQPRTVCGAERRQGPMPTLLPHTSSMSARKSGRCKTQRYSTQLMVRDLASQGGAPRARDRERDRERREERERPRSQSARAR